KDGIPAVRYDRIELRARPSHPRILRSKHDRGQPLGTACRARPKLAGVGRINGERSDTGVQPGALPRLATVRRSKYAAARSGVEDPIVDGSDHNLIDRQTKTRSRIALEDPCPAQSAIHALH